jgi:hypothetical protein
MSILRKVFPVFCGCMMIVAFTGCKKEGPAERAGRNIDETVDKAGKTIKESAGKAGEKVEEAGRKVKESTK